MEVINRDCITVFRKLGSEGRHQSSVLRIKEELKEED